MSPPPLELESLLEEVLLRLPPDEPASLVRAALVCKSWRSVISGASFRRRFCEFHRTPRMLGFFVNLVKVSRFVRASSTCPPFAHPSNWRVIDVRHGRVILHCSPPVDLSPWKAGKNPLEKPFIVGDPVAGHWRELPLLPGSLSPGGWNAAVLCAASTCDCDHLDCHRGHFLVVLVGKSKPELLAYVYSSETGAWSEARSAPQHAYCSVNPVPSALVGNALYFSCWNGSTNILKYDLGTQEMCVIDLPANGNHGRTIPMATEGGGLGIATLVNSTLYLRSLQASHTHNGGAGWAKSRSTELKTLLPACCDPSTLYVIGAADSIGVIFLCADIGILAVDMNLRRVTTVWNECWLRNIFPFLGFYTPAYGTSTGEGPSAGISSS